MIPRLLLPADLHSANLAEWVATIADADRAGWPMVLLGQPQGSDPLDGLALAATCAVQTRDIGLCVTLAPETVEPFTFARGLATLDHLSAGRAAWHLAPGPEDPGQYTPEFAEVVTRLLLSWREDALIGDTAAGMLSRADASQPIAHDGARYHVRGPLNVPRPPQGVVPRIALPLDPIGDGARRLAPQDIARLTLSQVGEMLA